MLPIDLIFFDLDGTLLDTQSNIAASLNATLKNFGLPAKSEKLIASFIGIGVERLVADGLGPENQELLEKAIKFFREHQRRNFYKKVKVYPGVWPMLEYFKNKKKVIITNKNYFVTRLALEKFALARYFQKILGGDAPHLRKPEAAKIKRILKEFSIPPDKAIIVGDMTIDILTGKNAGIHTCAVTYGIGRAEDIAKAKPEFLIKKAVELKKIIY